MAQTLPNGVVVPNEDGQEPISATGVQEMRTLGASVDTVLASKASTEHVDSGDQAVTDALMPRVFSRGGIPNYADFNAWNWPERAGLWDITSAAVAALATGLPPEAEELRGQFLNMPNAAGMTTQIFMPYGYSGLHMWVRSTNTLDMSEWTEWVDLAEKAPELSRGSFPNNANVNEWNTPEYTGMWELNSTAIADLVTGLPESATGQQGQMLVLANRSGITFQQFTPYGYYGLHVWVRSTSTLDMTGWSDWVDLTAGSGTGQAPSHTVLQSAFMHAMGGPIDTKGRGAVSLRFDHGLKNFAAKVLPLTRARGIKVSQAYNPRRWHLAENEGITATDLNGWVADGDVEIWNHSAEHLGAETREGIYDQIVNGLREIESELPAARGKVWGFNPPGLSTGDWMGFNDGRKPENWNSYAGHVILEHHAVATGYILGTRQRVLDGVPRDGLSHLTIDGTSLTEIKAEIDTAANDRTGINLMLHPSQLDLPGMMTTAQLTELLDYIVAKREAGEIATLSPYEMVLADSTRPPVTVPDVTGLADRLAVLEYDSGPRNINSLVTAGVPSWTRAHRSRTTVDLYLHNLDLTGVPANTTILTLPTDWRPLYTRRLTSSSSTGYPYIDSTGALKYNGTVGYVVISGTWLTTPTIPASPLGDPA